MLNEEDIRKRVPLLRSCEKETPAPIIGDVKGQIPPWLRGTLVRVGSGLFHIGPDHYNHVFDGMALLHRFSIQDGEVTYLNKFLRSDSYRKNMEAGRIVVHEFGTNATVPDPCKTIFERMQSTFSPGDMSDNDLVNIVQYTDEFYVHSETNKIWKINPQTLESLKKVDLSDHVPIKMATAHTHKDKDGCVYNIGNAFGWKNGYTIVKFPPKSDASEGAFDRGTVLACIPFRNMLYPNYYHSFGMTEYYIILVEQPVTMSILGMMFSSEPYANSFSITKENSRFHVVRRSDGEILPMRYTADEFFIFHHINAYEDEDHLVVDMCCYEDGKVLNDMYIKSMVEKFSNPDSKFNDAFVCKAKRFVLPLEKLIIENGTNENIIRLPGTKATARIEKDEVVHCTPEIIEETGNLRTELPRINYSYNGIKYKYFYACGASSEDTDIALVKVNVNNGSFESWCEPGMNVSEPVFVAHPNSSDEDDGVILSSMLDKNDDTKVSLLILDAKTMTEIARASFTTESSVPGDFHGIFIESHSN